MKNRNNGGAVLSGNVPGIVDDATGEIDMQRLIMIAGIAAGGLVLILIIILIVLAVRKNGKRKTASADACRSRESSFGYGRSAERRAHEGLDAAASLLNIKNERSMELKIKSGILRKKTLKFRRKSQILPRGGNNNG